MRRLIYMKGCMCLLMVFASIAPICAQNIASVTTAGDTVRLDLGTDGVEIVPISNTLCEIDYNVGKVKTAATMIVDPHLKPSASFTTKDIAGDPLVLKTANYTLKITKTPFALEFLNAANVSLFKTSSGSFSGSKCDASVVSGTYYGVFSDPKSNRDLTFKGINDIKGGRQGYAGAPFVFTPKGFGVLYDSDYGSLELTGTTLTLLRNNQLGSASRVSNSFFLMAGASPNELMKSFYMISGFAQMPPLWSLGFLNSQWGLNEAQLNTIITNYRQKKIPIDGYIFDYDWMGWNQDNYGEFKWNTTNFPSANSGALKTRMDSIGIHMMGIRKPRVAASTVEGKYAIDNKLTTSATPYTDYTGVSCVNIDFYKEAARTWFWQSFIDPSRNPYKTGIVAYWNDEADDDNGGPTPTFNFMYMQKSQYDGQRAMNNQRVFSLNRAYFSGAQRYAYGHWTGDIGSGFEAMDQQPLNILKAGFVGSGWTSMDIGGFSAQPTSENYYRWMQMGSLAPIYRIHGSNGLLRQPWVFGADAERIAGKAINMRYTILPYIYSMYWKFHTTGLAIMHPLMMDFPADSKTENDVRSYMFGDYIMAAPIYAQGSKSATFYAPNVGWYNYWTDQYYAGGADMTVSTDGDVMPILVRKGAIVPTRPLTQYSGDPAGLSSITFNVYVGDSATFNYYEDDFNTYDYENGVYAQVPLVHTKGSFGERITVQAQTGTYTLPPRSGCFSFHGFTSSLPTTVMRGDSTLTKVSPADFAPNTWTIDSGKVKVMVSDPFAPKTLTLSGQTAVLNPTPMMRKATDVNFIQLPHGKVRIVLAGKVSDVKTIDIVTLAGERIVRLQPNQILELKTFDIDLQRYSSQTYWCVVNFANRHATKKIVVTK